MFTVVLFFVVAAFAFAGALGVVLARNTVHAALGLVLTLIAIAVFFVMQGAHLDAAVQVIVYASAIVVLFLFVIMLLGVDRQESLADPLRFQRPVAIGVGVVALIVLIGLGGHTWATGAHTARGSLGSPTGNVGDVARSLFTDFLWPFELTSVLLVIAVVGSILLARRSRAVAAPPPEKVTAP